MSNITQPFTDGTQRKIGKCLLLASCIFLWIAAWRVYVEAAFISESTSVVGKVVAITKDKRRPTVEFVDKRGELMTFTSNSAAAFHNYEVGQQVSIRFSSINPATIKLDSPFFLRESAAIFLCFSVLAAALGLLTLSGKFVWGPLRQWRIVIGVN